MNMRGIAPPPATFPHRRPAHGACRIPTLRPSVLRPNAAIRMMIATIWAKVRAKRGERSNIFCRLRMLIRFRHFVPKILNHISILRIPKESPRGHQGIHKGFPRVRLRGFGVGLRRRASGAGLRRRASVAGLRCRA